MASPFDPEIRERYALHHLQLHDKARFDEAFGAVTERITDYTFANTFMWHETLGIYWKEFEGFLCVFANSTGDLTMFLPPLGTGNLSACLRQCFEIMDDFNSRHADSSHSRIEYVNDSMLPGLHDAGLVSAPMGGDYVYDMQLMIDLPGGSLKSKRQLRNRFMREHAVRSEPLTPEHVPLCIALLHTWQAQGDATHHDTWSEQAAVLRQHDTKATEVVLRNFQSLGLTGMVVWADEQLAGFTLGEPLSDRQVSILIEKTDRNLDGSAQFIFSEFCRQAWYGYAECNAGDDWGLPSLRWTKQSYHPIRLLGKHVVTSVATPLIGWVPEIELPVQNPPHMPVAADVTPTPAAHDAVIAIEAATEADLPALVSLEQRVFAAGDAFTPKQLRYLIRTSRSLIKVARVDGEVVGWAIALIRRHKRTQSARLYSLAVDPAYQGRGLGKRMATELLDDLERLGIKRCFLEVRDDNVKAQQLYSHLGFADVMSLPNYYGEGQHGRKMLRVSKQPAESVVAASLPRPVGLV